MNIIAITGKSGSGKTTLAKKLAEAIDGVHIDMDLIGHQSILDESVSNKLCEAFGDIILDDEGNIDRGKLGNLVFTDEAAKLKMYGITWGFIEHTIDSMISNLNQYVILDYAMLPLVPYWERAKIKILINGDSEIRKQKVLERDNIPEKYYDRRESASLDYSIYTFDHIFENDYTEESLNQMIDIIKKEV